MTAHTSDVRPLRKRMRGWRLAALASAVIGTMAGVGLASDWLTGGHVIVALVIAGLCSVAYLLWSLFSNRSRGRAAPEPTGTSNWEMRIRPHFQRDGRPEINLTRQNEGGEA